MKKFIWKIRLLQILIYALFCKEEPVVIKWETPLRETPIMYEIKLFNHHEIRKEIIKNADT